MNKDPLPGGLVLIKPIGSHMEPYTTADTVAEYAQVQRQTNAQRRRIAQGRGRGTVVEF